MEPELELEPESGVVVPASEGGVGAAFTVWVSGGDVLVSWSGSPAYVAVIA
jgi:hypothetical protein